MATDERRPVKKGSSSQRPQGSRPASSQHRSSDGRTSQARPSAEGRERRPASEARPSQPRREAERRPESARHESRSREDRARDERVRDDRAHSPRTNDGRKAKTPKNHAPRKEKKKSNTGKIILFAVEIIVLVAMVGVLYTVLKTEKVGKVEIKEEDIIINKEVKAQIETTSGGESGSEETSAYSGYRNIALFGVDSRDKVLTKNTRTDTIIIASINEKTGDVKLVSVYRDTYLNLGNDSYNKCNAAYAKGGPTQAINMLNMNLDMDITDFVTIGFDGLIDVIDALGGVEINVLESEIIHLNNYQISMVGKSSDGETFTATAGTDYVPVTSAGKQTLNGLQATAYCRIRYVGNDFMRAERQRAVIQACMNKAKQNPAKLGAIAESVFSEVYTSLDLSEIVSILGEITKYQIVDEGGFPEESLRGGANVGSKGSCVIPVDLEKNVQWLHKFLFDDADYETSEAVREYSVKIYKDVSPYM